MIDPIQSQIFAKGELVHAQCRRCKLSYRYLCKGGRRRLFCEPCRELELQDSRDFTNAIAKERRAEQRQAHAIHQGAGSAA